MAVKTGAFSGSCVTVVLVGPVVVVVAAVVAAFKLGMAVMVMAGPVPVDSTGPESITNPIAQD